MTECIKVYSRRRIPWRIKRKLRNKFGGTYLPSERKFSCPYENLTGVIKFCKRHNLIYKVENEFSVRSTDYRDTFFKTKAPTIGNFYFCSYCGRLVHKDNLTVDHLYPVDKAQKNIRLQKHLQRKGLSSINDIKNLVPACASCNSKKRAKMGLWVVKGEIGRIQKLWYVRHLIRIAVILTLLKIAIPYITILLGGIL